MTNIISGIIAAIIALTACSGCTDNSEAALISPAVALPSAVAVPAEYDGEPSVFNGKLSEALLKTQDSTKNTVYSPFSLYAVLAMLREGAGGQTLAELDAVLGSDDGIGEDMYAVLSHLLTLEATPLNITNSVWVDNRFDPKQTYLEALAGSYMAECYKADLTSSEARVNSYIEERTNGLIKKMLGDTDLDGAVMALVNTVYLDAEWQSSFKKESTHKRDFTNADGTVTSTDFMYNGTRYESVIDNELCVGVSMPYKDGSLTFVALMPKDESMTATELTARVMTETSYTTLAKSAVGESTRLYIPKFEAELFLNLKETLIDMGIVSAFTGSADFSGIAKDIMVDNVLQKAVIRVDEKGTEAAAATVATMKCTSAAPVMNPRVLDFNRPFSFAVVDTVTGVVLFCGEHNVAG